jgi:hypothetical protein
LLFPETVAKLLYCYSGIKIPISHTWGYGVVNWDYLVIKVDSSGNEEWHQIFGQPRGYDPNYIHDEAYGVRQTLDGGYIICGGTGDEFEYSESGSEYGPSDQWRNYIVRTDAQGNELWTGLYGGGGDQACEYMGLTSDGGYILASDIDQGSNSWGLVKLAPDPATGTVVQGCMDTSATNYNSDATVPCASCCEYPIEGCMGSTANNFDNQATVPCASCCEYPVYIGKSKLNIPLRIETEKSYLVISIPGEEQYHLRVTDVTGRMIYSKQISGTGKHRLNLFKRQAVYTVEIHGNKQRLSKIVFPLR